MKKTAFTTRVQHNFVLSWILETRRIKLLKLPFITFNTPDKSSFCSLNKLCVKL